MSVDTHHINFNDHTKYPLYFTDNSNFKKQGARAVARAWLHGLKCLLLSSFKGYIEE